LEADARLSSLGRAGFSLLRRRRRKRVEIACRVAGNELELAIPITAITGGNAKLPELMRFKWADNIQQTGEWSDFTINGDVAPNDRYNYRAVFAE